MTIIDTPWNAGSRAAQLRQAGVGTVIRYYDHTNSTKLPEKRLEAAEAGRIAAAGLRLAVTFQQRQDRVADFGEGQGFEAGRAAHEYATAVIGQPAGSAVYFSVDFDAEPSDLDAVAAFFGGVRRAFDEAGQGSAGFAIGAYGSGLVLGRLRDAGLASFFWLALSRGWADFEKFHATGGWHLLQAQATKLAGLDADLDLANPDMPGFGEFALGAAGPGAGLPAGEPHVVVARTGLYLRQGPGIEFPVSGLDPSGGVVFVLKRERDWGACRSPGDGRRTGTSTPRSCGRP